MQPHTAAILFIFWKATLYFHPGGWYNVPQEIHLTFSSCGNSVGKLINYSVPSHIEEKPYDIHCKMYIVQFIWSFGNSVCFQ